MSACECMCSQTYLELVEVLRRDVRRRRRPEASLRTLCGRLTQRPRDGVGYTAQCSITLRPGLLHIRVYRSRVNGRHEDLVVREHVALNELTREKNERELRASVTE